MRKLLASTIAVLAIGVFAVSSPKVAEAKMSCHKNGEWHVCRELNLTIDADRRMLNAAAGMIGAGGSPVLRMTCYGGNTIRSAVTQTRKQFQRGFAGVCTAQLKNETTVKFSVSYSTHEDHRLVRGRWVTSVGGALVMESSATAKPRHSSSW